jgi:hypothetical protein
MWKEEVVDEFEVVQLNLIALIRVTDFLAEI